MDVILFIHLFKLGFHQILFFIHFFHDPFSRSIVAMKAFKIPSSSLSSDLVSGLISLKLATRALLFPFDLRYVRHSCFMCPKPWHLKHFGPEGIVYWPPSLAFFFLLSWLLNWEELDYLQSLSKPFTLAFFMNFLNCLVMYDFILESSSSKDSPVSLILAFNAMLLLLLPFLSLVKPNSKVYKLPIISIKRIVSISFDSWCKCTFSPYILAFFHFSSYIFILPLLVPKPITRVISSFSLVNRRKYLRWLTEKLKYY